MNTAYTKGKCIDELIGSQDGSRVVINKSGMAIITTLYHPSQIERRIMMSYQPFELREKLYNNSVLMFAMRFDKYWSDASFQPQLAADLPEKIEYAHGAGMPCTIILVDSSSGNIVNNPRVVGLGTDISNTILKDIQKVIELGKPSFEAIQTINNVYAQYPTPESLSKDMEASFKISPKV